MYDLILKGGRIYDGSGMPSFHGDIAIAMGDPAIGRISESADRVVNVGGLAVAPESSTFTPTSTRSCSWDPLGSSSHEHGVTTVVIGNCGLTLTPCKPADRDLLVGTFVRVEGMPRKVLETSIPWDWTTHAEYLQALERLPLGPNVVTFVGHCAVRQYAMGEESVEREATDGEITQMEELVREGMAAGAFGFSTNSNQSHFREDGKPVPSRSPASRKSPGCAASSARASAAWCNSPTARSPHPSMSRTSASGTTRFLQETRRPVDRRKHPPPLERAGPVAQAVK